MAKLDREYIMSEYNNKCKDWGIATVNPENYIDEFGKLAKAGVLESDMIDVLYSLGPDDSVAAIDFTDVKWIKAKIRELKKRVPAPVAGAPTVVKAEVPPINIDADAVLGALGKSIGEALTGQYAPLIAEKAVPEIVQYLKDKYDIKERVVKVIVPDKGEATGVFHEVFDEVLTYVVGGDNVMLVGDAGTGKNYICGQIAEAMGLPFYFANKVSDEFQLKGFVDANGVFQETALYHAMKGGGIFMLDEMDASDANALDVLNSVLSDGYLTFPNGEFVKCHKDFHVIAGCNTMGTGATYQYVSRNQLDDATLNRFMMVRVDYSPTIEESLTGDADLLKFIRAFRKGCKDNGINHIVSYRNIKMLTKYVDSVGVDKAMRAGLLKNLEKDDLSMLHSIFANGWSDNRWAKSLLGFMS